METKDRRGAFGAALRRHRAAAGLSQEALAARSGISVDAIGMLERGVRSTPRPSTVTRLADALRLPARDRETFVAFALPAEPAEPSRPPEPGAGIPPDPIAHFVGRELELAALQRLLDEGGRVAVHGLGGVGKTQLVVRFLHRRRAAYPDGVYWLRADRASGLAGDLASLAWRLDLPEREISEQERQVEAVLRWLREHPRWLLVLDNLEPEAAAATRHWLPPGLPGHVLVTSRTPMWQCRLVVGQLPLDVASRFLLRRTGQTDAAAAGAVAEALGCLPLALEQAAAYLEVSGRDLAGYADLLRTRLIELMGEGTPEEHPSPVATTWQLSFERIEEECPAAADLLRLCACLAPDDIPAGVLEAGAAGLPAPLGDTLADAVAFDRAVAVLRRYSLVDRHRGGLRVHRLVQAVVRESLPAGRLRAWLAAAVALLRAAFPADPEERPECWPLCARLLGHVLAVERLSDDDAPPALWWLVARAGTYLWARGEPGMARPLHERALAMRERALGPDHPDTAESLNDLAVLLWDEGELTAARSLSERALVIRERVLGPDHPDTAVSLSNLGTLLADMGHQVAARSRLERALAIRERALGPDHPHTATSLNNLGRVLQVQNEMDAARPLHERALAIRVRTLGTDHPRTANSLHCLACVLQAQGDLAGARPLHERSLAIRERVLGPNHPQTALSLNTLAHLLRRQGELVAARPLLERALAICERNLGPDHPRTANALQCLGSLLAELGEHPAALDMLERALAISERTMGPNHPFNALSLSTLAIVRWRLGQAAAALPLAERALAIAERSLPPDHRWTVESRRTLAAITSAI